MRITIVAFRDDRKRSVAYREFRDEGKAVAFYARMLGKPEVRVISTRKVQEELEGKGGEICH